MARKDYVFKKSVGFVKRKTQETVNYEELVNDSWALLISTFRWYPDLQLRIMESANADFSLQLPQIVTLRYMARYQQTFTSATRGYGKTFDILTIKMLNGINWPGTIIKYVGPTDVQTAPLASAAFRQIAKNYPALAAHWMIQSDSSDKFEIRTIYNSIISISGHRGDSISEIVAEECAQEDKIPFNHTEFRNILLPTIRLQHMVDKLPDPTHIDFQADYITSPSSKQNDAYQRRCDIRKRMQEGGSAYAIDIPWQVAVLSYMKPVEYYDQLKRDLTQAEFLRECDARYVGTSEDPIIRDVKLAEARNLMVAENGHCGKPDLIYIVSLDVAYEDGAANAKCAISVMKCERQTDFYKRTRYLKSIVNVFDFAPMNSSVALARYTKSVWAQYCHPSGTTYLSVDSNGYGQSTFEALHEDLGDGLPPLCSINHIRPDLEKDGALAVIYPMRATPGTSGTHDPDGEMIRYAQLEFEHNNVLLLTTNMREGVDAYKQANKIKDDSSDSKIVIPYKKTKELIQQISNLKKKAAGTSIGEVRISKSIQRDLWSSAKYALRVAQTLEQKDLSDANRKESSWAKAFSGAQPIMAAQLPQSQQMKARAVGRGGGNIR